jgi:uncharacterized protein
MALARPLFWRDNEVSKGGLSNMATIIADPADRPAQTAKTSASPTDKRIEALDFVRGVALCGILLMNITGFGLSDAYTNPTNSGGATGPNLWAWIITQVGFEGTQRALFSMLFGASTILLVSRLERSGRTDAADIYYRRNLWLIGFGMVNAYIFLWWGDILYAYGLTALFLFPFRNMAPKWLIVIGVAGFIAGAAWNGYDTVRLLAKHDAYVEAVAAQNAHRPLSQAQQDAIAAWSEARETYKSTPDEIRQSIDRHHQGYVTMFLRIAPINAESQSWYAYRYFFDIFSMMLIGMALFRLGVLTNERPAGLYWAMLVGGYAVGLTVNISETRWIIDHQFSAIAFAQADITYDLGRLTMAIGHLGALLLFVRSGALGWLRRAFAAVGQMAVTNYLTHSVVCGIFFIGLGYFGQLERHQLYYVVFAIWAAQLVVSPLWLKHYRFGPVEWLWRSLTYQQRQPMRSLAAVTG